MKRITLLEEKIRNLYEVKNPNRADWTDWLFENHVFVVSEYAEKFAKRFGAKEDLAMAASMLHDIADAEMSRFNPEHDKQSIEIALQLLKELGFTDQEIETIIDAIRYHGCRDGNSPSSLEGKVMATADAVAHLSTDFYDYAHEVMSKAGKSFEEITSWALPKIERDYRSKIFFEDVRAGVSGNYQRVKALFSK